MPRGSSPTTFSPELEITDSARKLTLGLLTATCFFSYVDRQILAILVEPIRLEFGLADWEMGLLGGFAFALFYATLGIPAAVYSDRHNRRNIIAAALVIWSGFTALCGFANSFTQLLFYRIGVGVGEAGANPPSHSIIADLYPPERRAGALAIHSLGVTLGATIGALVGGVVAHFYGWRWAFIAVGAPGIILAVILRVFAVEPVRGASDPQAEKQDKAEKQDDPAPGVVQGLRSIAADRSAIQIIAGFTLTSTISYGLTYWAAAYYQRSFGFDLLQIATVMAPVFALGGVAGVVVGGALANWCARRWGLWSQAMMIAIMKVIALPFAAVLYLTTNPWIGLSAYFVSILFSSCYLGPTYALIQTLAPMRMRALWAAITLFLTNLIGLGVGPLAVGILSDTLRPEYGDNSLRWSLLIGLMVTPWAIYHYWRAGVHLRRRGQATGSPLVPAS